MVQHLLVLLGNGQECRVNGMRWHEDANASHLHACARALQTSHNAPVLTCRKTYLSAAPVDFEGSGNVAEVAKAAGAHVVYISSCLVTKKHR